METRLKVEHFVTSFNVEKTTHRTLQPDPHPRTRFAARHALEANSTSAGQQGEHELNWMNFYRLYSHAVKIFCRQLSQSCLYRLGGITAPRSNCVAFQSEPISMAPIKRRGNSI